MSQIFCAPHHTIYVINFMLQPALSYSRRILAAFKKLRQAKTFKTNGRNLEYDFFTMRDDLAGNVYQFSANRGCISTNR